jgi:hypothetical protein
MSTTPAPKQAPAPKTTTVYNMTDVSTPALKQRGMVGITIAVGPKLLPPGASGAIPDEDLKRLLGGLQKLVTLGALAVNQLPAAYVTARASKVAAATPAAPVKAAEVAAKAKPAAIPAAAPAPAAAKAPEPAPAPVKES